MLRLTHSKQWHWHVRWPPQTSPLTWGQHPNPAITKQNCRNNGGNRKLLFNYHYTTTNCFTCSHLPFHPMVTPNAPSPYLLPLDPPPFPHAPTPDLLSLHPHKLFHLVISNAPSPDLKPSQPNSFTWSYPMPYPLTSYHYTQTVSLGQTLCPSPDLLPCTLH